MNPRPFLIATAVLSTQLLLGASSPDQQEAMSRLQHAVANTNIFELPSFVMKADVEYEHGDKRVDGTYRLLWNGPDQWREEVTFPGYSEIQIGDKGTIWLRRSTDFIPVPVFLLHQALGFGSSAGAPPKQSLVRLDIDAGDTIGKIKSQKKHDQKLTCFEVVDRQRYSSEICMIDSTEQIAREASQFKDADVQPVGSKVYPRNLRDVLEHSSLKVIINDLATPAQFPPDAFTPTSGLIAESGCMNPTSPHLVKRADPEYPMDARRQHVQGTVSFDVKIGTDGLVTFGKVVENPGAELVDSARRALTMWRYDPATCNGQPVVVSTVLQVNYTLSR